MYKVHFLINSGYGRTQGHTAEEHQAFVNETTSIFESLGWKVFPPKTSGKYPIAKLGNNSLYLYHSCFVGSIQDKKIEKMVMNATREAATFNMYGIEYNYEGSLHDLCFPSIDI